MSKPYPPRTVVRADPPPPDEERARRQEVMRAASERTAAHIAALREQDAAKPTAHLDPWCAAPLEDGTTILFGYALTHEATGGLAWLASSELLELDDSIGQGTTASGRRYRLGRRFEAVDVGAEGDEARWAFEFLVGRAFEDADALRDVDRSWLEACKAARHLGVSPPARSSVALNEFFRVHGGEYIAKRAAAKPG